MQTGWHVYLFLMTHGSYMFTVNCKFQSFPNWQETQDKEMKKTVEKIQSVYVTAVGTNTVCSKNYDATVSQQLRPSEMLIDGCEL